MQQICNPELCSGCAACANGCPKAAITMAADEKGFLRPAIAQDLCVNCGLCKKLCPQNERIAPEREGKIYAALAVNDELRAKSSSGGIFSLLAEKTLREGGAVFGAAMDKNLHVRHIMAETPETLELLRGSKYVQSEMGDSYRLAKEQLERGRKVLFSGTPCQIDALKHFLGKDYENLLAVDILCHGVPSPAVLRKFIESREQATGKKVVAINFRDKDPGWSAFSTTLFFEDGTKEIDNSYYYFFVWDYCTRESCAHCLYSSTKRVGDITLGDFWGYKESAPEHIEDDDLGISLVSVNTEKGLAAFRAVQGKLDHAPRRIADAAKGNPVLVHPCAPHERSAEFWGDFPVLDWDTLVEKYGVSREKKRDKIPTVDREYYDKPYKQRHLRHRIHCRRVGLSKTFRRLSKREYVLYAHGGSGNHGCEALVRSTMDLLSGPGRAFALTSYRPQEDYKYGLSAHCTISKVGDKIDAPYKDANFARAYYELRVRHNYQLMDELCEAQAANVKRGDIAFSIGGDSYCYSKKLYEELIHQTEVWKAAGMKTVLWGVSIEPELLENQQLRDHFASFDLITARETISFEALKNVNPNTVLVADTAFLLKQVRLPMPEGFENAEIVGINTSPLIEKKESQPGIARKNFERLIDSILKETDYKVLLIPHVVWKNNDDRSVLRELCEQFSDSGRVAMIEDHNCMELKGYISRCRFFIGARTHSTIAAYSTGVPTLVLGYSTKSKGIAKDLFGSYEHYVLPVQSLKKEEDLTENWHWLQAHEEEIRTRLGRTLPDYIKRTEAGREAVQKL